MTTCFMSFGVVNILGYRVRGIVLLDLVSLCFGVRFGPRSLTYQRDKPAGT